MKYIVLGASSRLAQKLIQRLKNNEILDIICVYRDCFHDLGKGSTHKFEKITQIQDIITTDTIIINFICCYGRAGEAFDIMNFTNFELPLKYYILSDNKNAAAFINCGTSLPNNYNAYAQTKNKLFPHIQKMSKANCKFIELSLQAFYGLPQANFSFIDKVIIACLSGRKTMHIQTANAFREFVHLEDVVSAIEKVLYNLQVFNEKAQKIDIGSFRKLNIKFICDYIKEKTNSPIKFIEEKSYNSRIIHSSDLNRIKELGWVERNTFEKYVNDEIKHYFGQRK